MLGVCWTGCSRIWYRLLSLTVLSVTNFFWKTSCEEAVAAITWLNQTLIGIRDVSVSFIFSEQIFTKACGVLNADD